MTHLCFRQHLILSFSEQIHTEPIPHQPHVHQSLERLQHPQQAHHLERKVHLLKKLSLVSFLLIFTSIMQSISGSSPNFFFLISV